MNNLTNKSDAELRENLQASRQMLTTLIERLADRPDMEHAVRRLMSPKDILETFKRLAENDPVLMERVFQASVAALVKAQSVEAVVTQQP